MRQIVMLLAAMVAAPVMAMEPQATDQAAPPANVQPASTPSPKPTGGTAVITVAYYAKPGKADEVLSHRQHASDVLEKLGLPRGRVMRRAGGSEAEPDVMWECEYPNGAALARALEAAQGSPEFDAVRKHMATLLRNAERRVWEVHEPTGPRR